MPFNRTLGVPIDPKRLLGAFETSPARFPPVGDTNHRQLAGTTGDDHDRAADDLFAEAAGICLIIGAFMPDMPVAGVFKPQGLVLFFLYLAGVVSAIAVAGVLKLGVGRTAPHPLLLELPAYRWPHVRNLLQGLLERTRIFLLRVGNMILSLMMLL